MARFLFLILAGLVFGLMPQQAAPNADGAAAPAPNCKPQAPIAVTLSQRSGGAGGAVELAFGVSPLRDLLSLDWELVAPGNVILLSGQASGRAAPERGALTAGSVILDLPADGAYRRVELRAYGSFATTDAEGLPQAEPIEVVSALTWGTPLPDAPVQTRALPHGGVESVVVLPSAWRAGR